MSKTTAELLTSVLADVGATHVFGIVGDALNAFTDAIRRDQRMHWYGVRHEEGAALAAAGQAKLTGRLGVCAGTTGPGANHLLAGLYEAKADHAPVLAIAGDVPMGKGGIDYLQSADHVGSFRDACVYAATIGSADAAPAQIHEAIAAAYGQRGVALLNIPQDVIEASTKKPALSTATLRTRGTIAPDEADLDAAAALLDAARTITLFVGHGARDATAEVLLLADALAAPVVHTYRALDQFAFDDPRVVGGLGMIGSSAGYEAMHDADAVLMVGSDYPYTEFLPTKAKVVQIDERAAVIGRRLPVAHAVVGSARPALAGLLRRVRRRNAESDRRFLHGLQKTWGQWQTMLAEKADPSRSADVIHPQALARAVSDLAADDAVFCIDTGTVTLWAANWLRPRGTQRVTGSFNNAAVGTALGIANGVQALDAQRQVVVLCGDGGFAMLMQEFATSVQHRLPVKVFVFDNATWGLVHLEMEGAALPAFEGGTGLRNPDFAAFARACGGTGFRIDRPEALRAGVAESLATAGPVVVHVAVNADELPAMPKFDAAQAWRFAVGKARELVGR